MSFAFRLSSFLIFAKMLFMQNIPMVDLVGQYNKIKTEVDSAIQEILSTAAFINGPYVKKFQEDLQHNRDSNVLSFRGSPLCGSALRGCRR